MPGFDGTGPKGQGAMTGGRGRRNCFYNTGLSGWMRGQKGMPFGFAQGRQAFCGFGREISKEDELEVLKSQADSLKQQLEDIQSRIQSMAGQQGSDKK